MKLNIILMTLLALLLIFTQSKQIYSPETDTTQTSRIKIINRIKRNDTLAMPDIDVAIEDKLEFKKKQIMSHNNATQKLATILKTSEDTYERISAINQLEKIGGIDALNIISTGLSDNDINVRSYVIKSLSRTSKENALHLLVQILLSNEEQELKLIALQAISENINSTAISLLQFVSKNEMNDIVKHKVDDILARNQYETKESNEGVIEDYYDIMQRSRYLPPKKAVESLNYILHNSPDASIREDAILALANNTEVNVAPIIKETLLSDKSSNVRLQAIKILVNIDDNILPVLGQVLFNDNDPDIRIEAINLIAMDKSPATTGFLTQALNDSDDRVRTAAAQYLY